jgi:hypothetical protein
LTKDQAPQPSPQLGTLDLVEDEAFILVKAAPRPSETFGETVCCAGIDLKENWVRLYPVSFRQLGDYQKFRRWDHIRYRWSRPKATKDTRSESRRVDPHSIEIVRPMRQGDRNKLMSRIAVTSLSREHSEGRSLALLRPEVLDFWYERRADDEIAERERVLQQLRDQQDMFAPPALIPPRTSPYAFKYRYRDDDGIHVGTCQDWETEQTFLMRRQDQGSEKAALDWMQRVFGEEYPRKGMGLAMGTHRYRLHQWLINGVIRVDDDLQPDLFS